MFSFLIADCSLSPPSCFIPGLEVAAPTQSRPIVSRPASGDQNRGRSEGGRVAVLDRSCIASNKHTAWHKFGTRNALRPPHVARLPSSQPAKSRRSGARISRTATTDIYHCTTDFYYLWRRHAAPSGRPRKLTVYLRTSNIDESRDLTASPYDQHCVPGAWRARNPRLLPHRLLRFFERSACVWVVLVRDGWLIPRLCGECW